MIVYSVTLVSRSAASISSARFVKIDKIVCSRIIAHQNDKLKNAEKMLPVSLCNNVQTAVVGRSRAPESMIKIWSSGRRESRNISMTVETKKTLQ